MGGRLLRKGRYFDSPSLYVKTQRADRFGELDADIRYRATDADAEAERTDAEITAAVGRLSTELNTPVEIVTNLSTPPDGRKRASKGWYEGGRVYLVLPNAESVQDAVETVLHEVVGHRGLRALFGERFIICFLFRGVFLSRMWA